MTNLYGYQKAGFGVEALQRTGCDLTRESWLQAITTIKDWDPGWGSSTATAARPPCHEPSRTFRQVKDSRWVKMSDWMELEKGGRR